MKSTHSAQLLAQLLFAKYRGTVRHLSNMNAATCTLQNMSTAVCLSSTLRPWILQTFFLYLFGEAGADNLQHLLYQRVFKTQVGPVETIASWKTFVLFNDQVSLLYNQVGLTYNYVLVYCSIVYINELNHKY